MCFHNEHEMNQFMKVAKEKWPNVAPLVMRGIGNVFCAGYYVRDVSNVEQIAQAAANMKAWHPHYTLDFQFVNEVRARMDLSPVSEESLPKVDSNMESAEVDPDFRSFMRKEWMGSDGAYAA